MKKKKTTLERQYYVADKFFENVKKTNIAEEVKKEIKEEVMKPLATENGRAKEYFITFEDIQKYAYYLWERDGKKENIPSENYWYEAEKYLNSFNNFAISALWENHTSEELNRDYYYSPHLPLTVSKAENTNVGNLKKESISEVLKMSKEKE